MLKETKAYIAALFRGKPTAKEVKTGQGFLRDKVWPADKMVIDNSDPQTLPPGYVLDQADVVRNPPRVALMDSSTGATDYGTLLYRSAYANYYLTPWAGDTEGASLYTTTGLTDLARWRVDDLTINVNTANTAMATKHASYATEAAIISVSAHMADQATAQNVILTFQDEDDAAVEGINNINLSGIMDVTNFNAAGVFGYYGGLARCKTVAKNKTLEVDVNNFGAAGGTVHLTYMWRYCAE